MMPGRTADSANGSMTMSRWICQSGSTVMGRSSGRRRDLCTLLARVSDYDATPSSRYDMRGETRGVRGGVMIPAMQGVCLLLLWPAPAEVETRFVQVVPPPGVGRVSSGHPLRPRAV